MTAPQPAQLHPHVVRDRRHVLQKSIALLSRITGIPQHRIRLIELGAVEPTGIERRVLSAALWMETDTAAENRPQSQAVA